MTGTTTSGQGLSSWFLTPPGQYLLTWERDRFASAVGNLFGFNALQLGLPALDALEANRMPHRWLALPESADLTGATADEDAPVGEKVRSKVALVTHAAALPFPAASLDLLVLPHTLELSADPHAVLREVDRVLVPEGRVVITGLNPVSLWGLRQRQAHWLGRLGLGRAEAAQFFLPEAGDFIGYWRLRDWLRLLSFEVETLNFGCYRPAVDSQKWLQRWSWMDPAGSRWWPVLGAVYFMVAVKRVRGMHVLGPAWKPHRVSSAPVTVTQRPSTRNYREKGHT